MGLEERDDHDRVFAALGLVDRDRVREGDVAELCALEDLLVAPEVRGQPAGPGVEAGDDPDVAVEEVLVVVVPQLDDLVADLRAALGRPGRAAEPSPGRGRGVEGPLQFDVQVRDAGDPLVHRGQDLDVVDRVELGVGAGGPPCRAG